MSRCLRARTARIALRAHRRADPREVTVVFPAGWLRTQLLAYVRSEHPGETVRLIEWHKSVAHDSWDPLLWLCNPDGFADYARGIRAAKEGV